MAGLEVAVLIGVLLLAGGYLATPLRLPAPLVLLLLGLGLGFVPALGAIELPPDLVLLLFLPALLYWESLNISIREMRRNLRVILLNAIPLVFATVAAVAVLGHASALPWAVAIALGAIVAPTDATAVGAFAGDLPRRTKTVLRAESLINDGTALAIYAVAVAAATSNRDPNIGEGTLRFLFAYAAGIAIGVVGIALAIGVRRLVGPVTLLENTVTVLTPFAVYLPAELVGASGVIAVVTAGLILAWFAPRRVSARTRTQAVNFWQLCSYILNGTLFLLVGFEAHRAVQGLGPDPWRVIRFGLLTALLVIGVRVVWIIAVAYLIRGLDRRESQRARRVPFRQRMVSAWAGFRGAVSLAAALALPISAAEFPERDALIAVTLLVILVTLLVQGLTLPLVVRWAQLPPDPTEEDEDRRAERAALEAGLAAIPTAVREHSVPSDVAERVEREYRELVQRINDDPEDHAGPPIAEGAEGVLRRAVIAAKRQAVIDLRDRDEIDDIVLRRFQERLDIEDLRLTTGDREE